MPEHKDKSRMKVTEESVPHNHRTYESTAYLSGLFTQFNEQKQKYHALIGQLMGLEAQTELAEKTLSLARDHFAMTVEKTQDAIPNDWSEDLNSVRYVGIRLADACTNSLREHKKMTPEQLLRDLNNGMFRFRTNSPLREIHGALLRHPHVKREKGAYVWIAPPDAEQIKMRLRVAQREWTEPETPETKEASSETREVAAAS